MRLMMLTVAAATVLSGSDSNAQVVVRTTPNAFAYVTGDPDRAMIGLSTRSSGRRDTLGLLVESVTREGPAEKAGIEEGDRLVSVNAVNLRLSALDAGEPDMAGVANRRLVRELARVDAGAEVELRVYRDGATRTVRVKTVAADELNDALMTSTSNQFRRMTERAVLGLSLGGTGSRRDTLGILVVGVTDSGPAALGGIEEGDRVAAVNGVELRVAREDAGDWQASNARVRRLNREMEKVKAGDAVELRVYSAGQYRTVRVEAVNANDLHGSGGFHFDGMSGMLQRLREVEGMGRSVRVLPRGASGVRLNSELPALQLESRLKSAADQWRAQAEEFVRDARHRLELRSADVRRVRL